MMLLNPNTKKFLFDVTEASFLSLVELRAAHLPANELLKQLVFDAVTKQQQLTAGKIVAAAPRITKLSQIDLS